MYKSIFFSVLAVLLMVSCQDQIATEIDDSQTTQIRKELTDDQKNAIAWVDFAAALASFETGPASLLIGAAASIAYYQDKKANDGWPIAYNGGGGTDTPTDSEDSGVLHNTICITYLNNGSSDVNYNDIVATGELVNPYLVSSLNEQTENTFNETVTWAINHDFSTVSAQIEFLSSEISFDANDLGSLENSLTMLQDSPSEEYPSNVQMLIEDIANYNLSEEDKTTLSDCFGVLKHSSMLWE